MRVPLIYRDKPLFGLDIGTRTVKVVQIEKGGSEPRVVGYGSKEFNEKTIVEGIISDPDSLAADIKPLLDRPSQGKITAARVAASLPVAKMFIRTLQLPPMSEKDLDQALRFEAEQYIPVPINDLYLDYETIEPSVAAKEKHIDVLMVAAPRAIVDSYIRLFDLLQLEVESIEVSLAADIRAMLAGISNQTTLLLDFGSRSADLSIYDKVIRLTGTISIGGDSLTETLVQKLSIKPEEATEIKMKFGIAPSGMQAKVLEALKPQLDTVVNEVKKVMKYYKERSEQKHDVTSVVLAGGSASMPGLVDYLKEALGVAIITGDPWKNLKIGPLTPCSPIEAPMFTTAIGLALKEVQK